MKPLYINVDLDETIYPLMTGWRAWLKEKHGIDLPHEAFTDYNVGRVTGLGKKAYAYLDTITCFEIGDPLPGSIDALEALAMAGHHIRFVTTLNSQSPWGHQNKRNWLNEHVGDRFKHRLIFVEHHEDKGHYHGDVLIDDNTDNLRSFRSFNPDGLALCHSHPWNVPGSADPWDGLRFDTWAAVPEIIEVLLKVNAEEAAA